MVYYFYGLCLHQTVDSLNETDLPETVVVVSNMTLFGNSPDAVNVCLHKCRCVLTSVTCSTPNTLTEIPLMMYSWQTENVTDL